MIEKLGLVISLILNVLLIWDRFKPKQTILICNLQQVISPSNYLLTITNLNNKRVKIKNILLNEKSLSEYQLKNLQTKLPFIIHPKNSVDFKIYSSLTKGKPSKCSIEIKQFLKTKSLEFPL